MDESDYLPETDRTIERIEKEIVRCGCCNVSEQDVRYLIGRIRSLELDIAANRLDEAYHCGSVTACEYTRLMRELRNLGYGC